MDQTTSNGKQTGTHKNAPLPDMGIERKGIENSGRKSTLQVVTSFCRKGSSPLRLNCFQADKRDRFQEIQGCSEHPASSPQKGLLV
jgi:hypothetical protein